MIHAQIADLLATNARLRHACRQARRELAAAYGDELVDEVETVAPLEIPPPAWAAARDNAEDRLGVRSIKFFWSGI